MGKQVMSATGCRLLADRHRRGACYGKHGEVRKMGDDAVVESPAGGALDTAPESDTPGPEEQEDATAAAEDPERSAEPGDAAPAPASGGTQVVRDACAPTPAQLRVDFGAHLEANYRRLVAQLYAIMLDPAEAHAAVQDAYSRAWRSWATVSRSPDSVGWVRRVAVRSTIRRWPRLRPRSRRAVGTTPDTQTGALLAALRALPPAERRCMVLHHMAGAPVPEIAAVEGVPVGTIAARLARAQKVVSDGLAEFGVDLDLEFGADLGTGWDLDTGAFGGAEPSGGFSAWTPGTRPAEEEEQR